MLRVYTMWTFYVGMQWTVHRVLLLSLCPPHAAQCPHATLPMSVINSTVAPSAHSSHPKHTHTHTHTNKAWEYILHDEDFHFHLGLTGTGGTKMSAPLWLTTSVDMSVINLESIKADINKSICSCSISHPINRTDMATVNFAWAF